MHCFVITERVNAGFPIYLDGHPRVATPRGCPPLLLKDAIAKALRGLPNDIDASYGVREGTTCSMEVQIGPKHMMLCGPMSRTDRMALVRLATSAGVEGKVSLTSSTYDYKMSGREVYREHRPFPDVGVVPLCTPEVLETVTKGVEDLDILVQMHPGSSLRIFRTGELEGASPQLFVNWTGRELRMTMPRRYEERASAGFFEAAV